MLVAPSTVPCIRDGETPDITRRLLGCSAIVSQLPGDRDISVSLDVPGFVRRILLFDTYVLYSVRLKEIPEMVRHFGFQGTMDLLSSGALEVRCECAQFVEGQFKTLECPPLTYQFHVIEAHVWEDYLIGCLPASRHVPELSARELMDLQGAVIRAVKRTDNRQMFASEVSPAFEGELLSNERLVKAAILHVLSKEQDVSELDYRLKIHKVGDDARYKVETDLHEKLRVGPADIHPTIKSALLGVSGLLQRIGEMKAHSALSGFTEDEMPLFRAKLGSLAGACSSGNREDQFMRVICIAGLPDISPNQRIDVGRLLEIRNEPEAIEFRGWLADVEKLSDVELKERVSSLNTKIGLLIQRTPGKVLRLLATSVIGVANPVAGFIANTLDYFAWDKFFKRSGAAAFVNELYPSIFVANRDSNAH
jgi:hypothetical protein